MVQTDNVGASTREPTGGVRQRILADDRAVRLSEDAGHLTESAPIAAFCTLGGFVRIDLIRVRQPRSKSYFSITLSALTKIVCGTVK